MVCLSRTGILILGLTGAVFQPSDVARDILNDAARGYFGISNGLDGWLLKQVILRAVS
jgi:hypothetical protein